MLNGKDITLKYITDEKGRKKEVILPIKEYEDLIEDLEDLAIVAERRDEETVDHDEAAGYTRIATFKNDGGTLTQVGTTGTAFTAEDTAGWNVTFTTSGTDILLQVTGAASTDINWKSDSKIVITS